ncbi:putative Dihydroxyacetone kinase 1 [Glarea lozoyensis 74030]|uniref:Putative Dihydroxyacetone kinase 1 n=1 Tax=Glarea lozoyensis (strain ATCC 74030 / MF5533) TaxID=1104152 RepID=H0ELW8_GLAL7|nr:putative Dihydroxyacetone kinase 1 [Glarea lozoyensis 74030]
MSAKHFINDPTHLVNTALHALTITNPSVALDVENKIVYRRPKDGASQVSIISGGGSGHEPSFGAFVGDGLLAAGVAGTIFASPSAEQIRKAIIVGASLEHVHVPGRALPDPNSDETLAQEEVEIGMGIHNEPGSGRAVVELPELVKKMLSQLLDSQDKDRAFLNVNSNEVVLLINNLGGVSVLELGGITAEVVGQLEKSYNIKPVRILAGTYMTSLNGLGFSISILNVVNTNIGGPSMLQLLDAPCEATGWTAPINTETWEAKSTKTRESASSADENVKSSGLKLDPESAKAALTAALQRVIDVEPEVTRYDTVVGDGDCGIGLKRGAEGMSST